MDREGYIQITVGRGRWMREHRIIAEKVIRRPLERHEIVDHINGIRHDNRPENLRVMTHSEHAKMHLRSQWGAGNRSEPAKKPRHGKLPDGSTGRFTSAPIGSKCMHGSGYVQVKTPGGWKLEHRLVMERILGRKLLRREVVDHIDGNRANNDPANLRLFESQAKHAAETGLVVSLIMASKRRIRHIV